jgi:DNA primase
VGIVDEDIARVRAAADLVQVASEHLTLKKVGSRWQGLCPFHAEKTPSFSINNEAGLYHCFGCQASGDTITFVRQVLHLDFVEAVEWLAAKFGVSIHYDDAATTRVRARKQVLLDAMERAVDWYHERLLTAADAGTARGYLRSRGYDRETVERFRLGWAPDEWDALARAMSLPDEVLRDSGLGFVNRRQRQQDFFRARVMFPIFDTGGHPVAFGGRIMPGGEGPKYKNSQDSAIYAKSRTLYGLNWAKEGIAQVDEVIVCEGYTDVIAFFRAGVPRAVATCGTALADQHFRLLKNFARRIILAYDADTAGQAAAERFYAWEQQYEVDVAVAALPSGSDPGDLGQKDPDALRGAVEGAKPFLAFRVERALTTGNLRSAEGRARAADAALVMVAEHPNDLVRDSYVMQVADRCQLEPDMLRERLHKRAWRQPEKARDRDAERPAFVRARRDDGPEVEALRLAVHAPEVVADRLEEVLFIDEIHLAAFRSLAASLTLLEAIEAAGPEAGALLQRLAVEESESDPDDVLAMLARRGAQRAVARLESEVRSTGVIERWETIRWLKLRIDELPAPDATKQLVAWLAQSVQEGE